MLESYQMGAYFSQYSQEDDNDDVGGDDGGVSLNPGDYDSLRYAVAYQYMYHPVLITNLYT